MRRKLKDSFLYFRIAAFIMSQEEDFIQIPEAADATVGGTASAAMETRRPSESAKEALLRIRLERLRQDLLIDFQDKEPDLIDLKITVALEEAEEKFPCYDAAKRAFNSVQRQARGVLDRLKELLGATSAAPKKEELGEAQVAQERWTSTLRPALIASIDH